MGKRFGVISLFVFAVCFSYAQSPQRNLEKYWHYRDRLRERFVVVSQDVEEEGVNIPAGDIFGDTVSWSDGNSIMSHYLSLLSTELWLLKTNGQDYSQTLAELYYAMLALERLDLYSESHWRRFDGKLKMNAKDSMTAIHNIEIINDLGRTPVLSERTPLPSDINGMHLRDDVTPAFWNEHWQHFGVSVCEMSGRHPMEEISQDVMFHNIEGLALVGKLAGTENIANVPVTFKTDIIPQYLAEKGILRGDSVDFALWAGDIISRYVVCFQSDKPLRLLFKKNHWVLRNTVTGKKVQQGSGDIGWDAWLFYNYGLVVVGREFTGSDLRRVKGCKKGDWTFQSILTDGFNTTIDKAVLSTLAPGYNRRGVRITIDVLTAGVYELHILLMKGIAGICNLALGNNNDDYKVRSLASTSNYLGDSTFIVLKNRRSYDPCQTGQPTVYEHLPLINLALYDLEGRNLHRDSALYRTERAVYESLLNEAPFCGPTGKCAPDADRFAHNWSETSRCVWPENLRPSRRRPCRDIDFNGMDYMMLYNLYRIAFCREGYGQTGEPQSEN
ncbi:MAG: hypothetical protein IKP62_08470 [Salinivirgaceae bacterium]|nr:hypothetical protein [Salinivirgaceae bacterium]